MDYSNIINVVSGELTRTVGQTEWKLKVTFRTIMKIEQDAGIALTQLAQRVFFAQATLQETAVILLHGLQTASPGCGATLESVSEELFKNGYRNEEYREMISAILWYGLTGGKTQKKVTAEPATESGPTTFHGDDI